MKGGDTIDSTQLMLQIAAKLRGLRWGEVKVIVRDGRVTQVERNEVERFDKKQEGKE